MQDAAMSSYVIFLDEMGTIAKSTFVGAYSAHHRPAMLSTVTKRNANCTTLTFEMAVDYSKLSAISNYQIIHRAHSSASSVIVGFDQLACKAFYDGDMVYFTVDAALCLYFGINPVDWRRESPSHMHRVRKYQRYGYTPLFVGLSLKLADELDERTGYYVPNCQLLRVDGEDYRNVTGKVRPYKYSEIEMRFSGQELQHQIAARENPHLHLDEEWVFMDKQNDYRCLNIEDVPAVPFAKDHARSDYASDRQRLPQHDHNFLRKIIIKKLNMLYVYSDDAPLEVIGNFKESTVRQALEAIIAVEPLKFFVGTDQLYDIQAEIRTYVIRKHGVPALQRQIKEIVDARVKELETVSEPHMAKLRAGVEFIVSKPGAQFTGSFKPITRNCARDYWGSYCVVMEPSRLWRVKLTLLCIRKYHDPILRQLDKHVMAMIFFHLAMAHVEHVAFDSPPHICLDSAPLPGLPASTGSQRYSCRSRPVH